MLFEAIEDRMESFVAFQSLQLRLFGGAEIFPVHAIGHKGGTRRHTAFWLERLDLWAVLEVSAMKGGRYWNCFGTGRPQSQKPLEIVVEVNPPHEGANRQMAGLFALDDRKQTYLAHTGKIGGGRTGVGATAFRKTVPAKLWSEIQTSRGIQRAVALGPITGAKFGKQLSDFVHLVAAFKAGARKRP